MVKLKEEDVKAIKERFEQELKDNVSLLYFYSDDKSKCPYCDQMTDLLKQLCDINSKLKLVMYNVDDKKNEDKVKELKVDKVPALLFKGKELYNFYFFGIPAGYEFASLIEDIIDVSNGTTRLPDDVKEKLKEIDKPVDVKVFVTLTCHWCPRAVRAAHQFAIENSNIKSSMIESGEFIDLADKFGVMAVPKIIINDKTEFEGAQPEEVFLQYIEDGIKDE